MLKKRIYKKVNLRRDSDFLFIESHTEYLELIGAKKPLIRKKRGMSTAGKNPMPLCMATTKMMPMPFAMSTVVSRDDKANWLGGGVVCS